MYKLTVIAGPNRGSSYAIQDGENYIGRQPGNAVVLQSARVSKRHCVLVVSNGQVVLQDHASANGTFVNGVLTKARALKAGDRISVGEYVLQLVPPARGQFNEAPAAPFGNVLNFPATQAAGASRVDAFAGFPAPQGGAGQYPQGGVGKYPQGGVGQYPQGGAGQYVNGAGQYPVQPAAPAAPAPNKSIFLELKARILDFFDNRLMPVFYGLNQKNEWKLISAGLIGAFTVLAVILTVYPLLDEGREMVVKEAKRRVRVMAREIAEKNEPYLAAQAEAKTEIGHAIENSDGILAAVLVDMDNRIIAPSAQMNQYLRGTPEAMLAGKARKLFDEGRENGITLETDSSVIAVEPVRILSASAGKNVTVAMAVVSVDTSLSTPDWGEMGVIYAQALIYAGLLAGLLCVILYRMTLKPFQILNEDMNRVLKGEMPEVTHEFKLGELDPLWDLVNSALQRVPKGAQAEAAVDAAEKSGGSAEDFIEPFRALGDWVQFGVGLLDRERKIVHLNTVFEEVTGIRTDSGAGQEIVTQARDQAFAAVLTDLFERAQPGAEPASEDLEFSGLSYRVQLYVMSGGSGGNEAHGYLLSVVRREDG